VWDLGDDMVDSSPTFALPIKWVGIESIEQCIPFKPVFEKDPDPVHIACTTSLYCSLDKNRRGAHISRFPEILIKESNSSPKSIFQFCIAIAENIRESQKQKYGRIRLLCKHSIKRKSPIAQKPTLIPLLLGADIIEGSSQLMNEASIEFDIITMCPCTLEMSRKKSAPASRYGQFSHAQKAQLKLAVKAHGKVAYREILTVAEEVSCLVGTTLKRPDELYLVQKALKNPSFCEDIVRHALVTMKRHFNTSDSKFPFLKLKATIRNHECIHPFSIVASGEMKDEGYACGESIERKTEP